MINDSNITNMALGNSSPEMGILLPCEAEFVTFDLIGVPIQSWRWWAGWLSTVRLFWAHQVSWSLLRRFLPNNRWIQRVSICRLPKFQCWLSLDSICKIRWCNKEYISKGKRAKLFNVDVKCDQVKTTHSETSINRFSTFDTLFDMFPRNSATAAANSALCVLGMIMGAIEG